MWEQIQANRRRSVVLIIGMAVILVIIGYAAGVLIWSRTAGRLVCCSRSSFGAG